MNTRFSNLDQPRAHRVGTSRCDVPARSKAEGGTRRVTRGRIPSPAAALGDGERRSAPSLPGRGAYRRSTAAFTMVEIALCLAIVGFALVAIIGVLPAGLNVQKENREDTILNQDATVWLDAIRSGSQGYDELTNYVDRIRVESYRYDTSNTVTPVKLADLVGEQQAGAGVDVVITNGQLIVGLLSTPRIYRAPNLAADGGFVSNYVTAYVRAINSSAADAPPQDNLNVRDLSFRYRMVVEVSPVTSFDPELIQTNATDHVLRDNLSDVRLLFRWPLKQPFSVMPAPDPVAGNSRMSFRTQVGGPISLVANADYPKVPFFFLQPRQFQ